MKTLIQTRIRSFIENNNVIKNSYLLPMIHKYIFHIRLRVNDFFYKIILIYFHNGQIEIKYVIFKMCRYDFREDYPSKYVINNIKLENVAFYKN